MLELIQPYVHPPDVFRRQVAAAQGPVLETTPPFLMLNTNMLAKMRWHKQGSMSHGETGIGQLAEAKHSVKKISIGRVAPMPNQIDNVASQWPAIAKVSGML
jgi:hypothetical protein